ncbi:hypothetical protein D3C87_189970 [compost metagenome]
MSVKNKRKKSLVVSILLGIWGLYVVITGLQFWHDSKRLADQEIETRQQTVDYFLKSATSFLVTEQEEPLKASMAEAQKLHLVDFYILQKEKEVVDFKIQTGKLEDLDFDYQNFDMFMVDENMFFKTIKIFDYKLTAGAYANANKLVKTHFWVNLDVFLRDIALVTVLLWGVIIYMLKDILTLSKVLQGQNKKSLKALRGTSSEADILVSASQGYQASNEALSSDKELYAQTVGPAILEELNSGKEAPYTFESLMLRVDLNGYTQMFMDKQEYITDLLNDYFAQAREVISRYDGLIYQFVGDEIVFHIKENDKGDAAVKACLCVKALFEEAQLLEKKYSEPNKEIVFKLKASWSRGKMRFIKLDQGHAFSGLPLIESVRLLSQIDNKSHQFLAISEQEYGKIKNSVLVFSRSDVLLKGFAEASQIVRIKDFTPLRDILKLNRWSEISYYRSNSDIMELFKCIKNRWKTQETIPWDQFLYDLSKVKFTSTSEKLRTEITDFTHFVLDEMWNHPKEIATVVSAVPVWWGDEEPSPELCEALIKFIHHDDPRVKANTLLTLGHFRTHFEIIEEAMFDNHNRVKADALLALGKIQFTKRIAVKLEEMLLKGSSAEKKSARFVMKAIVAHYQEEDPVFVSANPYLKNWQELFAPKSEAA